MAVPYLKLCIFSLIILALPVNGSVTEVASDWVNVLGTVSQGPNQLSCDENPPECGNLFEATCSSNILDDGTGKTDPLEGDTTEKFVKDRSAVLIKDKYVSLLQSENKEFTDLAISALGLASSCPQNELSPACKASLVNALSEYSKNRTIGEGEEYQAVIDRENVFPQNGTLSPIQQLDNSPQVNALENEVFEQMKTELDERPGFKSVAQMRENLEQKIFPETKRLLKKMIEEKVTDPAIRTALMGRIDRMTLAQAGEMGMRGSSTVGSLKALYFFNGSYSNEKFEISNGLLRSNQSEFALVTVVAHELSHGLDPCSIADYPENQEPIFTYQNPKDRTRAAEEYPITGLISCLRGSDSVGAEFSDEPNPHDQLTPITSPSTTNLPTLPTQTGGQLPTLPGGAAGGGKNQITADEQQMRNQRRPAFCDSDRIGETVADWMAQEVLPEYVEKHHANLSRQQVRNGYMNSLRPSVCKDNRTDVHVHEDNHPSFENRYNKIILVQPAIRQQMGCQPNPPNGSRYCPGRN